MNKPEPSPRRRFIQQILWWALFHFVLVSAVSGGIIYMVAHFPPKAANIDGLYEALVRIEVVLCLPRKILLWLYPWEYTPRGLGLFLMVFNSLVWGLVLAALRHFWRRVLA